MGVSFNGGSVCAESVELGSGKNGVHNSALAGEGSGLPHNRRILHYLVFFVAEVGELPFLGGSLFFFVFTGLGKDSRLFKVGHDVLVVGIHFLDSLRLLLMLPAVEHPICITLFVFSVNSQIKATQRAQIVSFLARDLLQLVVGGSLLPENFIVSPSDLLLSNDLFMRHQCFFFHCLLVPQVMIQLINTQVTIARSCPISRQVNSHKSVSRQGGTKV